MFLTFCKASWGDGVGECLPDMSSRSAHTMNRLIFSLERRLGYDEMSVRCSVS